MATIRYQFDNKRERNAFLRHHNLCIAGSLNSWPNVQNQQGEYVGDAFQLDDGRHQVEIWAPPEHAEGVTAAAS